MSDEKDDDNDLKLRDKLAIAALPAVIERFNEHVKSNWLDRNHEKPTEKALKDFKAIAILAYALADEMRKARLQSFT